MPIRSKEEFVASSSAQLLALRDALASGNRPAINDTFLTIARSRGIETIAVEVGLSPTALLCAVRDPGAPDVAVLADVAERLVRLANLKRKASAEGKPGI